MELRHDLFERLVEVTDEGAADAARGHLGDLDAGLLQKAAVDVDLPNSFSISTSFSPL